MNDFAALIRIYRHSLGHYFVPPRWKHYFPLISLLSLGIGLLILEFLGFGKIFRYMNRLEEFPTFFVQFLLERLVGLVFLISYSMIFMSSMINGLSSFFISQDLTFLYCMPIKRWKILTVKFFENWITSTYLIVMFVSCFLLSHAYSFHLGWRQYVSGMLLLLIFTISPVALGSALLMVLIRFFPVRRIHQLVTLLAGAFLGALVIAVRMMRPERLMNPSDTDDYVRLIKDLTVPSINHLPSSWAAGIVVYGDQTKALLLVGFTMACVTLLGVVLHLSYAKAYIYSQESRSLRAERMPRKHRAKMRSKTVSMILKESRLFLRDATQWSQVLLLVALVIVYIVNIKNLAIQLPMVRWIVSFINLGLAGFVLAALSVRFLFPSVSIEGRAFWIVKTLPISFRSLLWTKYLIYFPSFLIFTQLLVYFSNRILQVPDFFMQLSLLNIFAVTFALTGMAIGIGALLPNFKSDNPAKIAVGPGGVLYMLLSFVYLALMLLLQLRPVWYYVIGAYDDIAAWMYFAAAFLLTLAVGLIPMEWGARRLSMRE